MIGEHTPRWLPVLAGLVAAGAAGGAVAVGQPLFVTDDDRGPQAVVASPVVILPAPPPVTPALPPAPPVRPPCGATASVRFAHSDAYVPRDLDASLAPIAKHALAHPELAIHVDGHADPSGDEFRNLLLSKRRAHTVAKWLLRAGIPRDRIVERAFGAYVPVAGETNDEQRRVRVTVACDSKERP